MLGEVIRGVSGALGPIDKELFLVCAILEPEVAHINGLGAASANGAIGNTSGSGIVRLDGSGTLRTTELFENGAENDRLLTVMEQATSFSLGSRSNHNVKVVSAD